MIHLIDFFIIFVVIITITLIITSISNTVSYFKGKKTIKFFTKDKLIGMFGSFLKLTLIIFLLRQAILYDGLWWLALIIMTIINEFVKDKKKV
jgi:hypothetical protein